MKKGKKTINQIVDKLINAADKAVEFKIKRAFGGGLEDEEVGYDMDALNELIGFIRPHIQDSQQAKVLGVKSSSDIIKLLTSGKISTDEAMEMLKLIKSQIQVEEQELKLSLQKSLVQKFDQKNEK